MGRKSFRGFCGSRASIGGRHLKWESFPCIRGDVVALDLTSVPIQGLRSLETVIINRPPKIVEIVSEPDTGARRGGVG